MINYWNAEYGDTKTICLYDVIFGHQSKDVELEVILLYGKYFIYCSDLKYTIPKLNNFVTFLVKKATIFQNQ